MISGYPASMTGALLLKSTYPFADRTYRREELAFREAPIDLQALLREQAKANGTEIVRDVLVELRCRMPDAAENIFVVFWPSGDARMNILAPAESSPSPA